MIGRLMAIAYSVEVCPPEAASMLATRPPAQPSSAIERRSLKNPYGRLRSLGNYRPRLALFDLHTEVAYLLGVEMNRLKLMALALGLAAMPAVSRAQQPDTIKKVDTVKVDTTKKETTA